MDPIRASVEQAHDFPDDEAHRRLESVCESLRTGMLKSYPLTWKWIDPRTLRFDFKGEKGEGGGTARLEPGRVWIEIDARYKLPWYATVGLAQMRVRDELGKALRDGF